MVRRILNLIHEFNAAKELNRFKNVINDKAYPNTAENVLSVIFDEPYNRFFWIKQVRQEFLMLCQRVQAHQPKIVLEIGTANGGSLFSFAKLSHPNARIFSIDLPGGDFGGGYPSYRQKFYRSFAKPEQQITLMRADSHSPETVKLLKDQLQSELIDFLFIDGDHTYEGVKKDFELYAPLVRNGGLIALHDIAVHPKEWNVGVDRFWAELKMKFSTHDFINDIEQGWGGIGVIDGFDPPKI